MYITSPLRNKRLAQIPATFINCQVTLSFNRPVVCASALKWFIRYLYYRNLQFLSNVAINQTKDSLLQALVTSAEFWLFRFSCFPMTKMKKDKRTNNGLENITQKTKD
jgi:hypothetical protein